MLYTKNNQDILKDLDKTVWGHQQAKKVLINVINRSRMRAHQRWNLGVDDEELVGLQNVMLIGTSGTGKTHLVETVTKMLNVPLITVDATMLAPTSANGVKIEDIEGLIQKKIDYYSISKHSKWFGMCKEEIAGMCVVYIDEIDKLSANFDNTGWHQKTQATLLTFIENKGIFKNLTFIMSGAFQEMINASDEPAKKSIGFHKQEQEVSKEVDWEERIIRNGIIPEIMGRIAHVIKLDKLEIKDYVSILNEILIPKKQIEMSLFGEVLKVSKAKCRELAEKASKSPLGVRYLHKELQKLCNEKEFNFEKSLTDVVPLLYLNYKDDIEDEEDENDDDYIDDQP